MSLRAAVADHSLSSKIYENSPSAQLTMGKLRTSIVAVRFKNFWFWIDDRDFHSKRTFTFLMILFSLTEKGSGQDLPLVTIPSS
jgi:hypothetical protein